MRHIHRNFEMLSLCLIDYPCLQIYSDEPFLIDIFSKINDRVRPADKSVIGVCGDGVSKLKSVHSMTLVACSNSNETLQLKIMLYKNGSPFSQITLASKTLLFWLRQPWNAKSLYLFHEQNGAFLMENLGAGDMHREMLEPLWPKCKRLIRKMSGFFSMVFSINGLVITSAHVSNS